MKKIWEQFYECSCGGEGIALSREFDSPQIYLAFFHNGFYGIGALTWRQRLKHICQILTKGTCWADNVILNKNEANRLGKALIKFANKKDTKRYK